MRKVEFELTKEQLDNLTEVQEEPEEPKEVPETPEEPEEPEKPEATPKPASFKRKNKVIKVKPKKKPVSVECPYCHSTNTFIQYSENEKAPDGTPLVYMYKGEVLKSVYVCGACRRRFGTK